MEQYINQTENFEPSPDTKFKWLRIRKSKSEFNVGTNYHFEMPSYFNYNEQYRRDTLLFWCSIILELWGLSNIIFAGQDSPLILIGVPIAFLLDITAAICAHWFAGENCETRSRIFLVQCEKNNNKEKGFRNELKSRKYMKIIFNMLIILICFFKIVVFYGLNNGFDLLTFGISISYIIVALIHINISGFYIAEAHFRYRLNLEKKHLQSDATRGVQHADFSVQYFRSYKFSSQNELIESKDGEQELILKNKEDEQYIYEFKTAGIFQDDELHKIINKQKPENKIIVAFNGLSHQREIRNSFIERNLKNPITGSKS